MNEDPQPRMPTASEGRTQAELRQARAEPRQPGASGSAHSGDDEGRTKAGLSEPGAQAHPGAGERRRVLLSDISRLLARARDNKLHMLRQFLQLSNGRIFIPRSSQGPTLFSRIVDLDLLFARAEQKLLRNVDPVPAYETKARLERDICELHVLLIELCAELASTYDLDPLDPAIVEAVKRRHGRSAHRPAVRLDADEPAPPAPDSEG